MRGTATGDDTWCDLGRIVQWATWVHMCPNRGTTSPPWINSFLSTFKKNSSRHLCYGIRLSYLEYPVPKIIAKWCNPKWLVLYNHSISYERFFPRLIDGLRYVKKLYVSCSLEGLLCHKVCVLLFFPIKSGNNKVTKIEETRIHLISNIRKNHFLFRQWIPNLVKCTCNLLIVCLHSIVARNSCHPRARPHDPAHETDDCDGTRNHQGDRPGLVRISWICNRGSLQVWMKGKSFVWCCLLRLRLW